MLVITKIFKFEASHRLPYHDGKCAALHGHSYKLEVSVTGDLTNNNRLPNSGMIIDFGTMKSIVQEKVIEMFDHTLLNNIFENPTAEIMVMAISEELTYEFAKHKCHLCGLRLWETDTCFVDWVPDMKRSS